MTLKDALAICHPLHDFSHLDFAVPAETDRRLHSSAPKESEASGTSQDDDNLCHICGEPFDGDPAFDICAECEDYAASGERDADMDEDR